MKIFNSPLLNLKIVVILSRIFLFSLVPLDFFSFLKIYKS